jgi:hypothetical protein
VLAGGSRQRLLVWPRPVSFSLVRPMRHVLGYSRLETFPGAACYTTLSSFAFCRAVMPAAWQGSKAAPLQVLPHPPEIVISSLPLPGIECVP